MCFRNLIYVLVLSMLPLFSFGQLESKLIKKAELFEKNMAYADAISSYEGFLLKSKNLDLNTEENINLRLANLYHLVKDFRKAEELYAKVLNNAPSLTGEGLKAYLKYAQVLASNGKHKQAAQQWKKYSVLAEQDKRASSFIKLYSNLDALTKNASSYEVEYIGLNTDSPDFSPTYFEGGMVFVSGREQKKAIKRIFSWDNSSFLDLYLLEDIGQLNSSGKSAGVSTGETYDGKKKEKKGLNKLGSDYYTAPTANDNRTIANKGSSYISGSDYEESPSVETKKFSKALNSKYHEGPCSFFHNGKRVVFTRNAIDGFGLLSDKKNKVNRLHLYFADKTEKDWNNITGFPYNSPDYSTGHPSINSQDNVLYFVSDMPGGFGGTDIYYSVFKDNKWSKPQNLGGIVNTQGNEMFPFLDENDNLYFSSDGHPGLGDLDLFFLEIDKTTMAPSSKVRNLGAPLNSNKDDFGFITDGDRKTGYFSSNRKRGGADDDIYKFDRIGEKYGCRELMVAVLDKVTKKPIGNLSFTYQKVNKTTGTERARVNSNGNINLCLPADNEYYFNFEYEGYKPLKKFYSNFDASDFEPTELVIELIPIDPVIIKPKVQENKKSNRILVQKRDVSNARKFKGVILAGEDQDAIGGVKVKFINKCTGQVQEVYTKRDGSYEFVRNPECDYELVAFKDEFATSFELIERSYDKTLFNKKKRVKSNYEGPRSLFDTKLYKVGDVVQLENIYFSSDSYKLEKKAIKSMDDLAEILKRYPNMIIEVYAHTDTRGNGLDNLYLSQLRAQAVEKYLTKRGISKARIKAIGMGEKKPLNNCGDGVQCTEAEHQRNRRTEFKILQIQKVI